MARHNDYGKEAEQKACEWFLKNFQARLIAQNYRCKTGELDLVFEQQNEQGDEQGTDLVVIEVKARRPGGMLRGVESISPEKLRRLRKTIRHFQMKYNGNARAVRLDVLSWDGSSWDYIKNVWA
jgi:putative endonuclease